MLSDSIFSKSFYRALERAHTEGGYSAELWTFIDLISVPPWVLESMVNTAIVRWHHLLETPKGRQIAAFQARAYLEAGDFFREDIAGALRAEFCQVIIETAALMAKYPHPGTSPWN